MKDNVLILGLSKTGTSAISQAVWRSLGRSYRLYTEPTDFGLAPGQRRKNPLEWHERKSNSADIVSKCLIFPNESTTAWSDVQAVARSYRYKIWIDRDPRDRIISDTLYGWYWRHGSRISDAQERRTWEQKFLETRNMVQQKEQQPNSVDFTRLLSGWWLPGYLQRAREDQLRLYDSVCEARGEILSQWHIVKYEDFVDGNVDQLSDYLGVKLDQSIEIKPGQQQVARSKSYGAWRNWFTSQDVEFFEPVYKHYLSAAGYDETDWTLNCPPSLDSQHGSEYLDRIHPRGWLARQRDYLRLIARRIGSAWIS